jgi:hypothetical protein
VIGLSLQGRKELPRHRPIDSGKSHARRNIWHVVVTLVSLLWVAGCGVVSSNTSNNTSNNPSQTTSAPQVTVIPSPVGFGNVTVGVTNTQTVTLKNSGNSALSLSQANLSGTGFSVTGLTLPVSLDPGQQTNFNIAFDPSAANDFAGSLSLVSNAPDSPTVISLSGTGTTSHTVTLNWSPSTSTVAGYNVYRGSGTGGPYTKLNSSLITGTNFTDSTVQAGQTYYYVTTAVDSSNVESAYSNEVSAVIPTS